MPTYFQRPENALKRANEFLDVGKPQRALDALYDVIKSKKHRTWQKIHEPIMEKYLELCVDLKKSHVAKEGLYQYKNICYPINIKSLEDVVRRYLKQAETKTENARSQSHQAVVDVDDLDVLTTPESLLLSAVSGEDKQDRTDRAILTPWVKFLWESYRQCLDLLRNNSSFEKLYQDIAQQAFKFCLKYARKTEFRKLCDNLRTHLGHIHRHQHQQRAINLNNPESQAMHLETRLVQLDIAINMELWQEAFKAVEDIHGLITLSKKPPKPSLMANYYTKLGLVFWKSGNHMFHASAWHRLLHLSREQKKNLSPEELQRLASRVLCATLSIPIAPSRTRVDALVEQDDNTLDKQRRLATLLGLNAPPTRASLIKDLVTYNVVQNVNPELQNLYQWLEVEFHPLKLSSRVASSIEFIKKKEKLAEYVPALEEITLVRLVKQISQVYQTIEFDRLVKLAPFTNSFRLERLLVHIAKNLELQLRIDHKTHSLSFGTDLGVSQKEDVSEGPYLQSMPSEQIRNQLTHMASALDKAMQAITPVDMSRMRADLRDKIVQTYHNTAAKDHMRILQRRVIIEERKEEIENLNVQREQEESQLLEDQKRKQYEAEMARLEREMEERERQRRLEEHKEIQKKVAKERLEQLKSTSVGAKAFADLDENAIAEMDVDDILAKQVEQLEREKRELNEKLKSQEKKVDFLERAKRIEEIPLLEKQHEEETSSKKTEWENYEEERIAELKIMRSEALEHRDRLVRMQSDCDEFLSRLKDDRKSVFKDKLEDFKKKLVDERKRRMIARKEKRKRERRDKWICEREEEIQRKKDEELKKQREEEDRIIQEKREQEEDEYQERLKKLNEIEERKRQREKEIEERDRQKRQEIPQRRETDIRDRERDFDRERDANRDNRDRDRGPAEKETAWRKSAESESPDKDGSTNSAWKPKPKEGGWRERVKVKEESWEKSSPRDEERRGGGRDEWRDQREPPREREEERGPPKVDRDRPIRDDRGPASRDDWHDRPPARREEPARRDEWRDRPAPTRDDRDQPREWRDKPESSDRDWKSRDDRGPPDRDDRGPRDERRFGDDRGARDEWRRDGPPRGDDRDWRRDDSRRVPPRDDPQDDRAPSGWREREKERGGGREEAWRPSRDSRPAHDDPPRGDRFRDDRPPRDEPPRGDRFRDERPPPQRDDREWRKGDRDARPPPRDGDRDEWRSAPRDTKPSPPKPKEDRQPPPRDDDRAPRPKGVEEEWTTVTR